VTPYPYTDSLGRTWVKEFGCCLCQKYHRLGIDPEYHDHLHRQSKHGERTRVATAGEAFALELRGVVQSA
jgi:hypothetical protein